MATVAQLEAADRARQTSAERLSDTIARLAGTPWFVWLHAAWFSGWVGWNAELVPALRPIDPFVSHRLPLSRAPEAYRMWNDKTDDCTKVVLDPAA